MTRRNYGDEAILTPTISSGTRDSKSQPFLHTEKCKRASATTGASISKSHKTMKLLKRGKRSDASLRITRGHRTCLGFVEPKIAIQG